MKGTVKEMSVSLLRTGLLVDINSLYVQIQGKFGKARILQMSEYVKRLEDLGHTMTYKVAYSKQKSEDAPTFVSLLRGIGFETHFGNTPWNIAMALRAADIVPNVDCLVIGSHERETGRILSWAKEKGKLTCCFASGIPEFFNQFARCIEITEELLR